MTILNDLKISSEKKAAAPKKKLMPLKKKNLNLVKNDPIAETTEKPVEEAKEEKKEAPKKELKVQAKSTEKDEDQAKAESEEKIKKEEVKEETKEETKEEEKAEKSQEEEENRKEDPAPKKTQRSRKSKKEEPKQEIEMPTTTIKDYEKIIQEMESPFTDANWEKEMKDVEEEAYSLVIPEGCTADQAIELISKIDYLKTKYMARRVEFEQNYFKYAAKEPEGLIERIKKISATGSNEQERKMNGVIAVMNFKMKNDNLNLYEVAEEAKKRYDFYKMIINLLDFKHSSLMTITGLLKKA